MTIHGRSIALVAIVAAALIAAGWVVFLCLDSGASNQPADELNSIGSPYPNQQVLSNPALDSSSHSARGVDSSEKINLSPQGDILKITGRVLSKADRIEIESARVVATVMPYKEGQDQRVEGATDAKGNFILQCLPLVRQSETAINIAVSATGFRNVHSTIPCEKTLRHLDCGVFCLEPEIEFSTQIVDSNEDPLSGALVRFFKWKINNPILEKRSGPDGQVHFKGKEVLWGAKTDRRKYGLWVTKDGFADSYYLDSTRAKGSPFPDMIVMDSQGTWVGQVSDAETGRGIKGAKVTVEVYGGFLNQMLGGAVP